MGAWGTGLWEDDLSCDIQDEWNDLMDEGVGPRKATKVILSSWLEEIADYEDEDGSQPDRALLYISLAALQMRHDALTREIKRKALELINKGADLSLWEEADQDDLEERKKVLEEFKTKLEKSKVKLL